MGRMRLQMLQVRLRLEEKHHRVFLLQGSGFVATLGASRRRRIHGGVGLKARLLAVAS